MISVLLAASLTFTATATGVEMGTPLEFFLAGKDTDRDYETMFLLDEPIDRFLARIEKAGLHRGDPPDHRSCRLWPVGQEISLEPSIDAFVETSMPEGLSLGPIIHTGGSRDEAGVLEAISNMPSAVFSLYTLPQSAFLFNGIYEQGIVYGAHKAKVSLKKGEKRTFKLKWDENKQIQHLKLKFEKGNVKEKFTLLKEKAFLSEIDLQVDFADDLTLSECTAIANALAEIDSVRVKINGRSDGDFFYRAFLPLVKWRDRKERLMQPFEVKIGNPDTVIYIDEDWSVEGNDPKLTEKVISYSQMSGFQKTDTVFFYAQKETTVGRLKESLKKVPKSVFNHYVYWE